MASSSTESQSTPPANRSSSSGTARSRYQTEVSAAEERRKADQNRDATLAIVRLVVFVAAAVLLGLAYFIAPTPQPWAALGWIAAIGFLVVITWHENVRLKLAASDTRLILYRRLLARMDRNWDRLPSVAVPGLGDLSSNSKALVDDLDVFGPASLFQWLCLAGTIPGRQTLARWLLTPTSPAVVKQRQEAAEELSQSFPIRERLYLLSAEVADSTAAPERFVEWASGEPWLAKRPGLNRASWVGAGIIVAGIIAIFAGLPETQWLLATGTGLVVAGFLLNLFLAVGFSGAVHDLFERISTRSNEIAMYRELFAMLDQLNPKSEWLKELQKDIRGTGSGSGSNGPTALAALDKLQGLVAFAGIRHSPMLFIPYVIFQMLFVWDFRVLAKLESWQSTYGKYTPKWFDRIGQFEAIASAAALYDENPTWTKPEIISGSERSFSATGLGHPLLKDTQRVSNDVHFGGDRPLLLVTGSNMSGKSTLLRAIGLNMLLARCGAPVAAGRLVAPAAELSTSIRVRDSLKEGVSFFMAELHRLKEVVDTARLHQSGSEFRVFFLLDEILQGTNSRERMLAVEQVLESLLELGATGAISTHDLDLASCPTLVTQSVIVHFREMIETEAGQQKMTFDYRMRPGVTPTTNAMKLLELVGLGKSK